MSFHNENHVKHTRKTRRCDWCGENINKGDTSVATSGTDGSDFYNGRYHPECWKAISRYCRKYKAWGDELPDCRMNRGGTEERGEPETEPLDTQ